MISVEEAKNIIRSHHQKPVVSSQKLDESYGLVLAEDIYSPVDLPPFNQSAMDGYALNYAKYNAGNKVSIIGENAAGNTYPDLVQSDSCVRILTGAEMPEGTDCVVMQEKVSIDGNSILIADQQLKPWTNVRLKGSHIGKGNLALKVGEKITPAAAGFLSSMGITRLQVNPKPRITILITGNELIKPGELLTPGKIYESNSYALEAVLFEMNIKPKIIFCSDTESGITNQIETVLPLSDILIITGGISVGDYDFVLPALKNNQVDIAFHKVKQKPGKPICFGHKDNTLIFALPGNPASVLTCFYMYVAESILSFSGIKVKKESFIQLPMVESYAKKPGLTHFLHGKISNHSVLALPAQESYRLNSFSHANCIIELPEDCTQINIGELVTVHTLQNKIHSDSYAC